MVRLCPVSPICSLLKETVISTSGLEKILASNLSVDKNIAYNEYDIPVVAG